MNLVNLRDVAFGHGGPPLFTGVDLVIRRGERIGLVGRNGAGKSTLMDLIRGEIEPDAGSILRTQGLRVATLPQRLPSVLDGTVFDVVESGLLDGQRGVETDSFDHGARVERVSSRVGLDPTADYESMSVGMKRRVLLARALVRDPDLLLLDEPTNHLDIDGIEWLEQFLLRQKAALLFVTHDRAFLRCLATRVLCIDRARVLDFTCDYDTYLRRREADLDAEATFEAEEAKALSREEAWAKQGVKARRTRSQARLRALEELREERRSRRKRPGDARMKLVEAERSGNLVVELKDVGFQYDDRPIVRGLTTSVMRGDRIGVMGPNGSGKTTLLRLLLGEAAPTTGTIRHGVKLEIAYFDQLHAELDEDRTVAENVVEGDVVIIGDRRRHVVGYMRDFLFEKEQLNRSVRFLSGGERNRLLLARLFTRPSNVLVLDEPTNDLDAETVSLLEGLVADYAGTVLLVSHDREFLNNVVTSTLVLEGGGRVGEYVGGYDDWLLQRPAPPVVEEKPRPKRSRTAAALPRGAPRRRTYGEQLEIDALPSRIEELESEKRRIHGAMSDPAFYARDAKEMATVTNRLADVDAELDKSYVRWQELEELSP